jgi:hypothetical protein
MSLKHYVGTYIELWKVKPEMIEKFTKLSPRWYYPTSVKQKDINKHMFTEQIKSMLTNNRVEVYL